MNTKAARYRGFTLIEVMIVVAIIGILAAIAIPSYLDQMVKANRSAAQSFMLDLANQEHQRFAVDRSYFTSLTLPNDVSPHYTGAITTAAGPPPTFTITFTPIAGTSQAGDGVLVVNSAGVKTRGGSEEKWRR